MRFSQVSNSMKISKKDKKVFDKKLRRAVRPVSCRRSMISENANTSLARHRFGRHEESTVCWIKWSAKADHFNNVGFPDGGINPRVPSHGSRRWDLEVPMALWRLTPKWQNDHYRPPDTRQRT
jgi:hypothetical protein